VNTNWIFNPGIVIAKRLFISSKKSLDKKQLLPDKIKLCLDLKK
jgi:hypothetical protein